MPAFKTNRMKEQFKIVFRDEIGTNLIKFGDQGLHHDEVLELQVTSSKDKDNIEVLI